jgi:hypothetical protein
MGKSVSANYAHEMECLGTELNGSVTLKAWGKGRNRADALEQARKNAVSAALFAGIRNGRPDCEARPIFNMPNIREVRSDYFDEFFRDGGNYKSYVSREDESFGKKERSKGRDGEVLYGFVLRVQRSDLKKQMVADGLLNQ